MHTLPLLASEALQRLLAGNRRAKNGEPLAVPDAPNRERLAEAQQPFAAILACIDSRVAPELLFHQESGSLIVARIPGNAATDSAVATFEFAVAQLGVPLIFVLGHSQCGAIANAIEAVRGTARLHGALRESVRMLVPAVKRTRRHQGAWAENAAAENVRIVTAALLRRSSLLRGAVQKEAVGIAGGVYDIASATVTRLL